MPDGEAAPDPREAEGFAKGLEDDDVVVLGGKVGHTAVLGKVHISLVDDDKTGEGGGQLLHVRGGHGLGGRVPWRADEDHLGVFVYNLEHRVDPQVERGGQGNLLDGYIVDVGADAVHAVGGGGGNDIVKAWLAEDSKEHVDGLVGADPDENSKGEGGFVGG